MSGSNSPVIRGNVRTASGRIAYTEQGEGPVACSSTECC